MISENALLKRVHRFDEQALVEVYDRYNLEIYRYAMRQLGDQEAAEDCVAETFSRFLNAIKHGSGPRQYLRAYLYRVAHNWIVDFFRRQPFSPLPLEPDAPLVAEDDPAGSAVKNIENAAMRQAISRLTPDQRQVIVLKFLEEWENNVIAQALEKPVGAVKSLQHRALNTLRRLMTMEELPNE